MDYKDTLNLPKTDFPMRANLPNREPEQLKRWQQIGLNDQLETVNQGKRVLFCMMALPMPMVICIWGMP